MKKLFVMLGVGALIVSMSSCNSGSTESSADKAFTDSLSMSLGNMAGSQLNLQFNRIPEAEQARFDKAEILRGVKAMIMADTTKQSYVTGLQIGMQLWGQLYQMEESGIAVDRKAVFEAWSKAFMADSISEAELSEAASVNQRLMNRAQMIMQENAERKAEEARQAKMNEPQTVKNIEEGNAYLAQKEKEEGVEKTESGLLFKEVTAGQGDYITPSDRAVVKYKGTLPNGTVFDQNDEAVFNMRRMIPGFSEGMAKMQKGGKYIMYIPADLAYGVDGTPDGSVGPMQPLTFEVEVLDINPKN